MRYFVIFPGWMLSLFIGVSYYERSDCEYSHPSLCMLIFGINIQEWNYGELHLYCIFAKQFFRVIVPCFTPAMVSNPFASHPNTWCWCCQSFLFQPRLLVSVKPTYVLDAVSFLLPHPLSWVLSQVFRFFPFHRRLTPRDSFSVQLLPPVVVLSPSFL